MQCNNENKTVCIIGGGMSGLFTGALLAKNGYKVTVLEKNHIIGGGLQSFIRGDVVFNTGMQSFAGYLPGMISFQLCKYLGIAEILNVKATDDDKQEIVWTDKNTIYLLPKGREAYQEYLIGKFPDEESGIRVFLEKVFQIGHTYDYLFLNPIQRHADNIQYAYMTADEFVRLFIKDERLITIFEYIDWTTGPSLKAMSALEFCMMLSLYIIGSHRFVGGTKQMVDAIIAIIEEHRGRVINDTEVCKVHIENNKVCEVIDKNGVSWKYDKYVWACTPKILLDVSSAPIFRQSMTQRIQEHVNPFTMYIIFCILKKNTFPFINSSVYLHKPSIKAYLPQSIVLVTSPHHQQSEWAETVEIYVPASFDDLKKWQKSIVGKRGIDYEQQKIRIAQQTIDFVSEYYPAIKDAIDDINVASGLTIRDYYGNPDGATYGQQGLYLPIKTKVTNLFMTGQAVQNQGIAGIATVSTLTTETILGRSLIEEIAKA